jgi:hypothetical protein
VTGPTWVMLENVPGARADLRAKVVDFNETGIRIHVSLWLRANRVVLVKGDAAGVVPNGKASARVVDCRPLAGSGFTAGLTFEQNTKNHGSNQPDLYEILQVSRKADPQIIEWVYKLQAERYHPDNAESGDSELFKALAKAYEILMDPVKRAAYDLKLESSS